MYTHFLVFCVRQKLPDRMEFFFSCLCELRFATCRACVHKFVSKISGASASRARWLSCIVVHVSDKWSKISRAADKSDTAILVRFWLH